MIFLPTLYLDTKGSTLLPDQLEVIQIAAKLLVVAAFFQISDGIQVVVLGALRGVQDVKIPTLITFIAYWVIGFPICYFLGFHSELKSIGIWIGLFAGLTVSALLLWIRFYLITRRMIAI